MWTHTYPTARKPHTCEFCYRTIVPGEKYLRGTGFGEGDGIHSWAECRHCEAFRIICDLGDEWDHTYSRDDFTEADFPDGSDAYVWQVSFLNKWRCYDGELMPVPVVSAEVSK